MPDTAQERTETPTPRRRAEARQRGQVGRSSDLTAAVILLGTLLLLYATGRQLLARLVEVTRYCLGQPGGVMTDADQMTVAFAHVARAAAAMVLPTMLLALVLALLASFLQIGPLFTFMPLQPSLDKLNPINGLKRMFSARAFVQLVMGVGKMSILTLVAYSTIKGQLPVLATAAGMDYVTLAGLGGDLMFTLGIRLAVALLILAIIDFIYQRYRTEKELKMTKEEVREELRRMEGDPKIKQRRRQVQLELAMRRIRQAVPKADVVITNPTEYAVAIQYDADAMAAPRVVAKGADLLAQRIRELAIEHRIPIVERPPLARALYRAVDVGQEIPPQFYKAIAEILAYVYELAGKTHKPRSTREPVTV